MRELVHDLARLVNGGRLPAWCDEKKLIARVDEEERFYAGQFQAHLSEASSTAEHCRRHLLSPISDERFICDCTHDRADGGDVPVMETQEARIRRTQHRAANSSTDWEGHCLICSEQEEDEKTGRMYCCLYCRSVIHKQCGIRHDRNDFPFDNDEGEWICSTCAEMDCSLRHDSRCLECEGLSFLLRDIATLASLASHQNKGGENEERTEWIAESAMHVADLLRKYRAHKIRDGNQDQFQRVNLEMLSLYAAVKLSDWWGKVGHRRHHTACCEFPQGGIGMHGSYYIFRNPTALLRATEERRRGMKWDGWPPAPEAGGPEFICEFHRAACNDATQGAFETAAVRLASDEVFFSTKPWLTEGLDGETTDGCVAQYNSTAPMLYNLLNPFLKRKNTKEKGEGKDRVDSNGSNDQQKIAAEMNRKDGRLESAGGLTNCVDKDRPQGNVTAEAEFAEDSKPTVKIPPIKRLKDHKFADVEGDDLILWEFYSASLSKAAGKHVGLGPGWRIPRSELISKHALGSLKVPKATLRHNEFQFKTGSATANPLGLLSYEQRKAAQETALAKHEEVKNRISSRKQREDERRAEHHRNALLVCDFCGAQFQRQTWLKKHRESNCGRHLKHLQRRRQLVNESAEKRLEVLDEAELQEARLRHTERDDTIPLVLTADDRAGWVLRAKDGNASVPLEDATKCWRQAAAVSDLKAGDRVRCSAERFEAQAKKPFGVYWREHYFYGNVRRRAGRAELGFWSVHYDDEDEPVDTHFSHLERAEPSTESTAPAIGKAVIHMLDLDGAAARQAMYRGLTIETVNGVSVSALEVSDAISARIAEKGSADVMLRRPFERRPTRGMARTANMNEDEAYPWHPDVETDAVKLANNPMNAKRDHVVFESLAAKYKYSMSGPAHDRTRMMPPEDKVKGLCKREWVKRAKEKKAASQNAAAAAVAAVERGGGGGGDDDDDHNSDGDGDDDGDDDGAGDDGTDKDSPPAGAQSRDSGEGAGGGGGSGDDVDVVSALTAAELRTKLKELGERATVTNDDLGAACRTKTAEGLILRTRLRAAFAAL